MPLRKLTNGFLAFQRNTFLPRRDFFAELAKHQSPKIMLIGCSDFRVDPAILTNAEAGEIFMVRNVANLVPPRAPRDDTMHGTSAALEFAVTSLEVEHIVVLGHNGCGGIQALLAGDPGIDEEHAFIHNWLKIADEARRRTLVIARHQPFEAQLRTLEFESIKTSLANLLTFPFIAERIDAGRLRIHGWCFDISDGQMYVYVAEEDRFRPLTLELASEMQET